MPLIHHFRPWRHEEDRVIVSNNSHYEQARVWNQMARKDGQKHLVFVETDIFDEVLDEIYLSGKNSPYASRDMHAAGRYNHAQHTDLIRHFLKRVDETQHLTWLVPTQYPSCVLDMLLSKPGYYSLEDAELAWWRPNLWIGLQASEQKDLGDRSTFKELLQTQDIADERFLLLDPREPLDIDMALNYVSWVVVAGTTEPINPTWVQNILAQCKAADKPFFFKGWGLWTPDRPANFCMTSKSRASHETVCWGGDGKPYVSTEPEQWQGSRTVYKVAKNKAGRELDGRTYDALPSETA